MSFSQALSGLNAQQQKLGVLGNNIANSQTVGFKSSGVQFADVFANSQVGLGTRVSAVLQNFSEGNIESTNRNLDLAISGSGFYRFEQGGEVVYSRNGQLSLTTDGLLQNAQGANLMGYGLNAQGQVQVGGQPQVLRVDAEDMPAGMTTNVATTVNLDARAVVNEGRSTVDLRVGAGDDTEAVNYHFSNNFTVYDSLGNPRNVTVYYEKTDPNQWTVKMAMDGQLLMDGGEPEEFTLAFNTNGQLVREGGTDVNDQGVIENVSFSADAFLNGEAEDLVFDFNLAGSTQFGNTSTTNSLTQNGFTSGTLVGITIEDDGTIMRNYSNEQSRPSGQISLANFRNPEGLRPVGDNVWAATQASGQELVGAPGTGQLGLIVSGAIETSNVDMARELVDMIVAQRAYQANSQTIKTQDELLQTAINLR
ncbi:flagellar hook protein FlgE [Halomonas sp. JS92-SW72]|uniref:flagellar hook protein FlgE n=1 Tax=Halomonas sp. JS92-SW72 TaxID=2306583 RepID=UPI000E5B749E|nr:flagellar hook protein FlgE [Halomonas sp. JS92-SW72]AXY42206.1 flagellar hook protein FlgE [Halomonas sp. JS92-SW72]